MRDAVLLGDELPAGAITTWEVVLGALQLLLVQ
jgi:hypothetical protein